MKLLHVDSSILGQGSVSRDLSTDVVAAFRVLHPDLVVTRLDLAVTPIGHLTAAHLAAAQGAPVDDALRSDVAMGQFALEEFQASNIVVVGAPMYNLGIPSQLKAWIDRISVAGKTFRYGEHGPVGLCGGKKLVIASSRGVAMGPEARSVALASAKRETAALAA